MFTRSSTFALATMLLLALAAPTVQASSEIRKNDPRFTGIYSWVLRKWDEPDAPYTKIRRSIESELKKGVTPETLIRRYNNPQKFQDARLVFSFAVASYERARRAHFSSQSQEALPDPQIPIGLNLSPVNRLRRLNDYDVLPRNAESARIFFLWECNSMGYSRMFPVAQRLVSRFPNDFEVKWWAFQSIMYGERNPNTQLLLKWADDLQRQRPRAAGLGILKPMVYYTTWGISHSPADEKKAINGFQRFLATAPRNDPQRKNAEFRLRLIPTIKQIWAREAAKQAAKR